MRYMNGCCLNKAVIAHLQIFVTQHQITGSVLVKDQNALFKSGFKSGQICVIGTVFAVAINHQNVQCFLFHFFQHLLLMFLHGLPCPVYRYVIRVSHRHGDFIIDNLHMFCHIILQ